MSGLHLAENFGLYEPIIALLDRGQDPNCMDAKGQMPLLWAARREHVEVMWVLINKGGSPRSGNSKH